MKNLNKCQITKVQPQGAAKHLLSFFCQFQPGVAYKSVAYKKKHVFFILALYPLSFFAKTPQSGQTHSHNSSARARKLFEGV